MVVPCRPATILIVDKDVTVRKLLGRVLMRQGYQVYETGDAARALQLAQKYRPQLALLDLCLCDGTDIDLADQLHAAPANVPVIFVTGFPLRLHNDPALARPFLRLHTKPFDIIKLRQAVNAALIEGAMKEPNSLPQPEPTPVTPLPTSPEPAPPRTHPVSRAVVEPAPHGKHEALRSTIVVVAALVVLVGFVAYVTGVIPGMSAAEEPVVKQNEPRKIELVSGKPHTLSVPPDVRAALGIHKDRIVPVKEPTQARPLFLSGSTGLDPNQVFRIRVRFTPAEAVRIGPDEGKDTRYPLGREWSTGDVVRKKQLLALFYSIDVGNKKNDLVDAMAQLKLDLDILDASRTAYNKGALALLDLLAAERAVRGDINAVNRAEYTLIAWGIPEADLESVRQEANEMIEQWDKEKRAGTRPKRDSKQLEAQLQRWAKVEIRVPDEFDGATIVQRDLNVRDVVVDNTLNLFQLAKVNRMMVYVNVPEEDLKQLQRLPEADRWWTIRTAGAEEGIKGKIEDIGMIIDQAQHSAIVKGHIDNTPDPKHPEFHPLRGGQYVTAAVKLPAPDDVVEVPTDALADDGKQAGVFVEIEPGVYTFQRVEVVQRFDHSVFVRSRFPNGEDVQELTDEEKAQGLLKRQALKPGSKVITAGVLELKKELDDRESSAGGQ